MRVHDSSDKSGMLSLRGEQLQSVAIDRDINRHDGGDFYSMRRRSDTVAKDEGGGIGMGEEDGKSDLLGDGVAVENQRFLKSLMSRRVQVSHSGVVMLEGKISGEEV